MRIAAIVPALDEAACIADTLRALAPLRAAGHSVIVVDGGSADATRDIAAGAADAVIVAPRGRARQMNAGAAAAAQRGADTCVFVHADSRLPDGAVAAIAAGLASGRRVWGRFDVAIEGRSRWLPLVATLMNVRSRLSGI